MASSSPIKNKNGVVYAYQINADQAVGSTKRLGIHSRLKFTDVGRIEE